MAKWSTTEVYYNRAKTGSLNRPSTIYYLVLAAAPVPIAARSLCPRWPCLAPPLVASLPMVIGLDGTLHSGVQSSASQYNNTITHTALTHSREHRRCPQACAHLLHVVAPNALYAILERSPREPDNTQLHRIPPALLQASPHHPVVLRLLVKVPPLHRRRRPVRVLREEPP